MAQDFIIKKGHSSRLGLIEQDDLIENGWYLTTDTAEVYVALRQASGLLELKKINECDIDIDFEAFETKLQSFEAKDIELAALIQANTDKFVGYYTSEQVDAKVQAVIDAIPAIDFTPYATNEHVNTELAKKANAADVYTKTEAATLFMNQDAVDARINALIVAADPDGGKTITDIQNLVKYVDENASEIAGIVTATNSNTAKLAGITTTVPAYVADSITTALAGVVQPKTSDEISVTSDGTLSVKEISTDKLVQGNDTLVLNGGSAAI